MEQCLPTEKNWMTIAHYNQDYVSLRKSNRVSDSRKYLLSIGIWESKKNRKIINPLNQRNVSKLIIDYYVLDHIDSSNTFKDLDTLMYMEQEDHKGNQASPISKFTNKSERLEN